MRTRQSGQSRVTARRIVPGVLALACLCCAAAARLATLAAAADRPALVTLSIVGTSDLHGAALPRNGAGGLPLLSGYVNNLRAARSADGGAVLLLDSGDTFQGNTESNLSEGAVVVDAYNAMGYTAEAIGNHDFDFGSVDSASARQLPGDPRGALKARAAHARYPFLAANLIDAATGRPVEWPNVRPSVIVDAAGVKVGIIGVMTIDALRLTLAANVQGLRVAPLAQTITAEASKLRAAGAEVVVVAAHAGGRCDRFDQPADLSSCDDESEIFQLARSLPGKTVDVIAAGHTHGALAHRVAGVAIVQPLARGQAFGRVDLVFDRKTSSVARVEIFAPRGICALQHPATGSCVPATEPGVPAKYEGRLVTPDSAIDRAMAPALQRVHTLQATPLGVSLDAPVSRVGNGGSPLGNVFADALRAAVPGADVAVLNNAARGLWADLADGPLTFGRLYDVFPFDNRIVKFALTGAELGRWLTGEIQEGRRGWLGISGIEMRPSCLADHRLHVDLVRAAGPIHDEDRLLAVTIAGPTLSGSLASAVQSSGASPSTSLRASPSTSLGVNAIGTAPVVREVVEDWFRRQGRTTHGRFDQTTLRRPDDATTPIADCVAPGI